MLRVLVTGGFTDHSGRGRKNPATSDYHLGITNLDTFRKPLVTGAFNCRSSGFLRCGQTYSTIDVDRRQSISFDGGLTAVNHIWTLRFEFHLRPVQRDPLPDPKIKRLFSATSKVTWEQFHPRFTHLYLTRQVHYNLQQLKASYFQLIGQSDSMPDLQSQLLTSATLLMQVHNLINNVISSYNLSHLGALQFRIVIILSITLELSSCPKGHQKFLQQNTNGCLPRCTNE